MKKLFLAVILTFLLLAVSGCSEPSSDNLGNEESTQGTVTESQKDTGVSENGKEKSPIETEKEELASQTPDATPSVTTPADSSSEEPSSEQQIPNTDVEEKPVGNEANVQGTADSGFGVVAKSNNPVSSTEKDEIFTQLDKEINSLVTSIDEMDEVQAADLQAE